MHRSPKLHTIAAMLAMILLAAGTAPSATAADAYELDGTHSYVVFKVLHLGVGENWGRFNKVGGSYTFDADNPSASKVSIEIATDSVDTGHEKRDQHLKSPDFFNAKQFPVIKFEGTKIAKKDGDVYHVTGELSLHGVTREITIPIRFTGAGEDPWGNYRSGFASEFTVKRTDFGMSHMIPGIGEEVTIHVGVEGVRK